jgi:hypothetical protein
VRGARAEFFLPGAARALNSDEFVDAPAVKVPVIRILPELIVVSR